MRLSRGWREPEALRVIQLLGHGPLDPALLPRLAHASITAATPKAATGLLEIGFHQLREGAFHRIILSAGAFRKRAGRGKVSCEMALPSKLTSPLSTTAVNDPEIAAELNKNYTVQTLTNPGATATVDPTVGQVIVINTTTAATTLALASPLAATLQKGALVTVLINSSGATPTLVAGSGVHLAATISLTASKVGVVLFIYDGTELKEIAATAALS